MSEPSKRDRAVAEMERALRRARLSLEPDLGDVGLLVDLIVDAAAERVRAEIEDGLDAEAAKAAMEDAEANGTIPSSTAS